MSQQSDLEAIHNYFRNAKAANAEASRIRNDWLTWYPTLTLYQKSVDQNIGAQARRRRDDFNTAQVRPNTAPRGAVAIGANMPTLRQGTSDRANTMIWQQIIGVSVDGSFGPKTAEATRAWQRSHGLTADGVVGPKTWATASTKTVSVPVAISQPISSAPSVPRPTAIHVPPAAAIPAPIKTTASTPPGTVVNPARIQVPAGIAAPLPAPAPAATPVQRAVNTVKTTAQTVSNTAHQAVNTAVNTVAKVPVVGPVIQKAQTLPLWLRIVGFFGLSVGSYAGVQALRNRKG